MKKIMVQFEFTQEATKEQYDKVWEDLKASGNGNPKGLIFHVGAIRPEGGGSVVDIWESQEAFDEFGKVLMPIIQKNNLSPIQQPSIYPVHNIYQENK